jgi:hypothetical protein
MLRLPDALCSVCVFDCCNSFSLVFFDQGELDVQHISKGFLGVFYDGHKRFELEMSHSIVDQV